MINLMLGSSGGGKSYESVVYHILPALQSGREVWTNLPVNVDRIVAIEPCAQSLLKIVQDRPIPADLAPTESPARFRAFGRLEDYPQTNETAERGPLIVVDECHKSLPMMGTLRAVEEWYAEHRHLRCDVLLITQSYGKISRAIRDNLQLVYRVRKAVAFGSSTRYIRKVQDGLRGDVVNTAVRSYKKKYFGLYRSHTKGAEGIEGGSSDVIPIWRRWPFIGAALFLGSAFFGFIALASQGNPLTPKIPKMSERAEWQPISEEEAERRRIAKAKPTVVTPQAVAPIFTSSPPVDEAGRLEPYGNKGLHYTGKVQMAGKTVHLFAVSQNGQVVVSVTSEELATVGYRIEVVGECTGWLYYGKTQRSVVCDSPQISPAGTSVRRGEAEGPASAGGAASTSASLVKPRA